MRHFTQTLLLLSVAALVPACGGGGGGGDPVIIVSLVSSTVGGAPAHGNSDSPSISSDGRFVAFRSTATNLVASDTSSEDVYRKDLQTGAVIRVSRVPVTGAEPTGISRSPAISANGRFIAFVSTATDLVSPPVSGTYSNIYLYDADAGTTTLISHTSSSLTTEATGNSDNPCVTVTGTTDSPVVHVAYDSLAQNLVVGLSGYTGSNVYKWTSTFSANDIVSLSTTPTTVGNEGSSLPSISSDGNKIAYQSNASNLVADDNNNTMPDIFVRTMSNLNTIVSVTDAGTQLTNPGGSQPGSYMPSISADGEHVVFQVRLAEIVPAAVDGSMNDIFARFFWDGSGGTPETFQVSRHPMTGGNGNSCALPVISQDGGQVFWTSASTELINTDTNGLRDVFRRFVDSGALDRVSLTGTGVEPTGTGGSTTITTRPSITPTGSYVAFDSNAANMFFPSPTVRHVYRRG